MKQLLNQPPNSRPNMWGGLRACGLVFQPAQPAKARRLLLAFAVALTMQAQIRVEKAPFHGWPDAIILKNPVAAVVIVPSIGRIMNFSFLDKNGQPTEGPLWNNREMDGKPVEPTSQQWGNFGGD